MCESEAGFLRVHISRRLHTPITPRKMGMRKTSCLWSSLKIVFGSDARNVSAGGLLDLNDKKLYERCLDAVVRKVTGSSFSAIKKMY